MPLHLQETPELEPLTPLTASTPLTVRLRRHAGLYKDKSYAPELKNVLLLTASNSGYLEMLTNWECFATRLGLDWMVMAMNKELQTHLGERSFLATGQEWEKAEAFNSPVGFKVISCNKLRSVLDVMRETNLDIVFSDADNVFKNLEGKRFRTSILKSIIKSLSKRILASTMLQVVENRTLFREYLKSVWSGVIDVHLWMTRKTFGTALWLPGIRKVRRKGTLLASDTVTATSARVSTNPWC